MYVKYCTQPSYIRLFSPKLVSELIFKKKKKKKEKKKKIEKDLNTNN